MTLSSYCKTTASCKMSPSCLNCWGFQDLPCCPRSCISCRNFICSLTDPWNPRWSLTTRTALKVKSSGKASVSLPRNPATSSYCCLFQHDSAQSSGATDSQSCASSLPWCSTVRYHWSDEHWNYGLSRRPDSDLWGSWLLLLLEHLCRSGNRYSHSTGAFL